MKCPLVRRRLVDYIETELGLPGAVPLPERQREAVRVHLERCPGCREEVEAIRVSLATADMVGEVEPSVGFKSRTVGLLKEEAERLTSRVRIRGCRRVAGNPGGGFLAGARGTR